jgi:hypothetical protein
VISLGSRAGIIQRIRESAGRDSFPDLFLLETGRTGAALLAQWLDDGKAPDFVRGLAVLDGDGLLSFQGGALVHALNLSRDILGNILGGPLLIIISSDGAEKLSSQAPDLFQVRAGSYIFKNKISHDSSLMFEVPYNPDSSDVRNPGDIEMNFMKLKQQVIPGAGDSRVLLPFAFNGIIYPLISNGVELSSSEDIREKMLRIGFEATVIAEKLSRDSNSMEWMVRAELARSTILRVFDGMENHQMHPSIEENALRMAREIGNKNLLLSALIARIETLTLVEFDLEKSEELCEQAQVLAEDLGAPVAMAQIAIMRAIVAIKREQFEVAGRILSDHRHLLSIIPDKQKSFFYIRYVDALMGSFQFDEAREVLCHELIPLARKVDISTISAMVEERRARLEQVGV